MALLLSDPEKHSVAALETLMEGGPTAEGLYNHLSRSLAWSEGQQISPQFLERLRQQAGRALREYLEEHKPRLNMNYDQLADLVRITENNGRVTFDMPAEVRVWLIPRSLISF